MIDEGHEDLYPKAEPQASDSRPYSIVIDRAGERLLDCYQLERRERLGPLSVGEDGEESGTRVISRGGLPPKRDSRTQLAEYTIPQSYKNRTPISCSWCYHQ